MANEVHELHYATESFVLAENEDPRNIGDRIDEKLRSGGGWVEFFAGKDELAIRILVAPGVPIWFVRRDAAHRYVAPRRIR